MNSIRHFSMLLVATIPVVIAQDLNVDGSEEDPVISSLMEGLPDEGRGAVSLGGLPEDGEGTEAPGEIDQPSTPGKPVPEPSGVTVHVEAGSAGGAQVEASAVKLLAPFPAKPLFQPPVGWKLEHPQQVPPFIREVPLSNGTKISLTIRPHVLVPDSDGESVIGVQEPGYNPSQRYAQTGTMGAVLTSSVESMEEDSRKLGDALDRLGQLLSSLPSPEPAPEPEKPSPEKKR